MRWTDASEIVAGLALKQRLALGALRPDIFMPPYNEIIKAMKNGDYDVEDLILKVGLEPVQAAIHAQENVNGLGSSDWVQILETSYTLYSAGQQLEKLGKKMQSGEEPDPAKLSYITKQFQDGKSERMPLSKIESMEMPFIESGWATLDDHTGGLPEAGLVVVGGNPGVGKTSLMAKLASSFVAKHPTKRVAVYSLEMILSEIAGRFREVANLTKEQEDRIEISEKPMTVHEVVADASIVDNVGLVMVDFADYMIRGENSESKMAEIYMTLATGAKLLHCPIILLSQFNRSYDGGIPRPRHIRYTSSAEFAAWMILMLYNPANDFYEEKDEELLPVKDGAAYILVWKIRGGFRKHPDDSPGAILTPFKGSKGWYSDKSKWFSLKKETEK